MKKFVSFVALALLLLAGCTNSQSFVIKGTAEGVADGTPVYVAIRNKPKWDVVDSTTVQNGAFELKGELVPAVMAYLFVGEQRTPVVLESGEITFDVKEGYARGTELNDRLVGFVEAIKPLETQSEEIYDRLDQTEETDTAARAQLEARMNEIDSTYMAMLVDLVEQNIGNALGVGMFVDNFYIFQDDAARLKRLADGIPEEYRILPQVAETLMNVENTLRTAVGSDYIDFAFTLKDGTRSSLKQLVDSNRFVLIDFWASWCAPCRASLPGIKQLYDTYHEKGLEILGVSLDKEQADWEAALERFSMSWLQVGEMKYWDSEYAALYGVRAIPATVLINHEGKIIGRSMSEEEINEVLAEKL